MATAQAADTATREIQLNTAATGTVMSTATAAAITATRQAFETQQAEAAARQEQITTIIVTIVLVATGIAAITLLIIFFCKVMPVLVSRLGLMRYGQHGNPCC